jgi:hypothetical protein
MKWLSLLLLAACAPKPPPAGAAGPSEAVQEFSAAIHRGDSVAAWALLSSKTQQQANQLAAISHPDAGGAGFAGDGRSADARSIGDGRSMLFAGAIPGGEVTVSQVHPSAGSAEVQTALPDGGPGESFRVVREADRWRVDLDLGR